MMPACLSIIEAAVQLGVSRSKTLELIAAGDLATVRIGRRVLVPSRAIDDFISSALRQADPADE